MTHGPRGKATLPSGTLYTCPMHPEIVQEGPEAARSAAWQPEPLDRLG